MLTLIFASTFPDLTPHALLRHTGVNDDELQYLKKNTADLREKVLSVRLLLPSACLLLNALSNTGTTSMHHKACAVCDVETGNPWIWPIVVAVRV